MRKITEENADAGVTLSAKGIDVACRFFWGVGLPAIESRFPSWVDRFAAGLVAAGSDCAGNDDEVSRDHDWGPRFHVYLSEPDFADISDCLQSVLDELPTDFEGLRCGASGGRPNRVLSIDAFFREKTSNGRSKGFCCAPKAALDWLRIPEHQLFDLTHGQVFYDPPGEFTGRRQGFAAYYPDDAWRKRLAAALYEADQHGQRLLPRALARDDYYTAELAWWRFAEHVMKVGFLLNRRYAPWEKWLYKEFCKLPELSREVANLLWDGQCDIVRRPEIVDRVVRTYSARLSDLGLIRDAAATPAESLVLCAEEVSAGIKDPEIARLAPQVELVLA